MLSMGFPTARCGLNTFPSSTAKVTCRRHDFLTVTYASPVTPIVGAVSDVLLYIVIGSLILLAISGGFSLWALRRSLRPLSEMADNARTISPSNWELNPPARSPRHA